MSGSMERVLSARRANGSVVVDVGQRADMTIRSAEPGDAAGMGRVAREIAAATGRTRPCGVDYMLSHYIHHPDRILCSVAVDADGTILGFQSLKLAPAGNSNGVAEGWGMIGTHISPQAARRGIGKALFAETLAAARQAGVERIDATIGAANTGGLAYYEAMGFRTYRGNQSAVCKVFEVRAA